MAGITVKKPAYAGDVAEVVCRAAAQAGDVRTHGELAVKQHPKIANRFRRTNNFGANLQMNISRHLGFVVR